MGGGAALDAAVLLHPSLAVTRTGRTAAHRISLVITSLAIALLWDQAAGEQEYASPGLQPQGFPSLHRASLP